MKHWFTRRAGLSSLLIYCHDVAAIVLGLWCAIVVRYTFENKPIPDHLLMPAILSALIIALVLVPVFRLHQTIWAYTTFRDLWRLLRAIILVNLLVLPVLFLLTRLTDYPRSAPVIAAIIGFGFASLGRVITTMVLRGDWRGLLPTRTPRTPTIIVGDMTHVDTFIRSLTRAPSQMGLKILGVVTPENPMGGRRIHNLPIISAGAKLENLIKTQAARGTFNLVFVDPTLRTDFVRLLIRMATPFGAQLLKANPDASDLDPLSADELLTRPSRTPDLARIERLIHNRRVMITGAGGAIGSELARQVASHNPETLILAEQSEFALYEIDLQIRTQSPGCSVEAKLLDVRDPSALQQTMAAHKPHLVLHAAALKHVPIAEAHPAETVQTNVKGTLETLKAAHDIGAAFVLISTDKAVNPSSVMGATKRLCELMTSSFAAHHDMTAATVRFGNVLGSSGSVVPLFQRQIAAGGPITITDKDATRYFMTVTEASGLVLQAASLKPGLYVLDMGEPVPILTMAKRLLRLKGLDPETFPIEITGLRPGERLSEALFMDHENPSDTDVTGLWGIAPKVLNWSDLKPDILALLDAAERYENAAIFKILSTLVPEYSQSS